MNVRCTWVYERWHTRQAYVAYPAGACFFSMRQIGLDQTDEFTHVCLFQGKSDEEESHSRGAALTIPEEPVTTTSAAGHPDDFSIAVSNPV